MTPLPEDVCQAGPLGPDMTAAVAFFKGACHISYTTSQRMLRELLRLGVSRAMLAKARGKVCRSRAYSVRAWSSVCARSRSWARVVHGNIRGRKSWLVESELKRLRMTSLSYPSRRWKQRTAARSGGCSRWSLTVITQDARGPPARAAASVSGPLCHLQEARPQCVRGYPLRLAGSLEQHRLPCTTVNGSVCSLFTRIFALPVRFCSCLGFVGS